jgi:glycerol uptake facilitator-like aquaporin
VPVLDRESKSLVEKGSERIARSDGSNDRYTMAMNERSGRGRPIRYWVRAFALAVVAIYIVVIVIIGVSSRQKHSGVFLPTIIILLVVAAGAAWRALRLWRKARGSEMRR